MSKVHLNLSQLFQLFLLVQLFHSLRWNRRNRWNTPPAQPIPKNCHIPFTIPLFHLFLFPKIVNRNAVLDFSPHPFSLSAHLGFSKNHGDSYALTLVDKRPTQKRPKATTTLCWLSSTVGAGGPLRQSAPSRRLLSPL